MTLCRYTARLDTYPEETVVSIGVGVDGLAHAVVGDHAVQVLPIKTPRSDDAEAVAAVASAVARLLGASVVAITAPDGRVFR